MNRKIMVGIVLLVLMVMGIVYWRFSNDSTNNGSDIKNTELTKVSSSSSSLSGQQKFDLIDSQKTFSSTSGARTFSLLDGVEKNDKSYYQICGNLLLENEKVNCKGMIKKSIELCEKLNSLSQECVQDTLAIQAYSSFDKFCYVFNKDETKKNECITKYNLNQVTLHNDKSKCNLFSGQDQQNCNKFVDFYFNFSNYMKFGSGDFSKDFNESFCDGLGNSVMTSMCKPRVLEYKKFKEALFNLDEKLCNQISDKYYKYDCISTIALYNSYLTANYEDCKKISNLNTYSSCLPQNQKPRPSFDNTIVNIVKATKKTDYCNKLVNADLKSQCFNLSK